MAETFAFCCKVPYPGAKLECVVFSMALGRQSKPEEAVLPPLVLFLFLIALVLLERNNLLFSLVALGASESEKALHILGLFVVHSGNLVRKEKSFLP